MAGWELLGKEEKKAINRIFDKEGESLSCSWF